LDEFKKIFRRLGSTPRNPDLLLLMEFDLIENTSNLFAWLMMPLPFMKGITDVDAVLNETTRPSAVKGDFGSG
jgi:hypothetical protein